MLKNILKNSKNIKTFSKLYNQHLSNLFSTLDLDQLSKLERELLNIRKNNFTLFSIGNGGAAATSMTLANDIGFDILKKTKKKGFKIINLSDNTSIVTAIANDIGYENIFVEQLRLHFKKGDALIVFSASGNSKNLIKAAKWVKKNKGKVFSVVGFDGGLIKKMSDICIHFHTEKSEYGPVEDCQLMINHILAHWFQGKFGK